MSNVNYVTNCSDKSKRKTFWLCLLLGYIGVHDLYIGKIGSFLIKMVTANFFLLGWAIDLLKIATGSYKDNVGMPLRRN